MRTLYFSRNYNPRLAVATARHLGAPVTFTFAAPLAPGEQDRFRRLNPNLRVPILVEGETALWEADAIACRLSRLVGSDFWREGDDQPDMIRWLSWGTWNFVAACDKVHFERVTKRRYDIAPTDDAVIAEGLAQFAGAAAILADHLAGRRWLLGDAVLRRFPHGLRPARRQPGTAAARRLSGPFPLVRPPRGPRIVARSLRRSGRAGPAAGRRAGTRCGGARLTAQVTTLRPGPPDPRDPGR